MDSGNEVVVAEAPVITINGVNGHTEDLTEMKTRSKSAKGVAAGSGSDTEKKDKKILPDKSKKEFESSKTPAPKDNPSVKLISVDVKNNGNSAKKIKPEEDKPKKKNAEREDDSGINSRASSVSNDETSQPRMRTRSSRTSEVPSTSTPARKGPGRMPISSYDFDDLDEDVMSPMSLKRKAVLYIEEMDEEMDEERTSEPQAKRSIVALRTNLMGAIFYPFRALRSKLVSGPTSMVEQMEEKPEGEDVPPSSAVALDASKENITLQEEGCNELSSQTSSDANTCRIM